MNKTELENEINELKDRIAELEATLEEKEVKKGDIWIPEKNEDYFYIDVDGQIMKTTNVSSGLDEDIIRYGNYYPTEEKAEFEANREKYTRLFRQYVEQHSEPLDWEDSEQEKYCVGYGYKSKQLEFDYNCSLKNAFVIYASSQEVLLEAIDFVGEKNFKKYILEIKEEI